MSGGGFKMVIGVKGQKYGLTAATTAVTSGGGGVFGAQQTEKAKAKPQLAGFFSNADDDDDAAATGESSKSVPSFARTANRVERLQAESAIAQDPTIFAYDEVFDDMKASAKKSARQKKDEKLQPKYIKQLLANAAERKREDDLQYEKKLLREKKQELDEFGDTEKFITSSYRKQMEENKRWVAEKEQRDAEIDKRSIVGKTDTNGIIANILNGRLAGQDEDSDEKHEDATTTMTTTNQNDELDNNRNHSSEQQQQQHQATTTASIPADVISSTAPIAASESTAGIDNATTTTASTPIIAVTCEAAQPPVPVKRMTLGWDASIVPQKSLTERKREAIDQPSHFDESSKLSAKERYLQRKKAKIAE